MSKEYQCWTGGDRKAAREGRPSAGSNRKMQSENRRKVSWMKMLPGPMSQSLKLSRQQMRQIKAQQSLMYVQQGYISEETLPSTS